MSKYEKIKIFLLGALVAIGFMLLLGASGNSGTIGRYQIATTSHNYGSTVCILDTTTGVVSLLSAPMMAHWGYYPEKFPQYTVLDFSSKPKK